MGTLKNRKHRNDGPVHRIINSKGNRNANFRVRRMTIVGTVIITLLFIGKILLGFFDLQHVHVSIVLADNSHYKEGNIYDVLGDNLENIITDSEAETVTYLKENLSYVKDAYVSKNYVKRQLTIEITERVPFARLKHIILTDKKSKASYEKNTDKKNKHQHYLIDDAGYVLETITSERDNHLTLILDEGTQKPEIGRQIKSGTTQRGIHIVKLLRLRRPELSKHLTSIDARVSDMITINFDVLPMPAWIASDLIEVGLHHIWLFIKQQGLHILQREKMHVTRTTLMNNRGNKKDITIPDTITYLDARYDDTLFLGGESR